MTPPAPAAVPTKKAPPSQATRVKRSWLAIGLGLVASCVLLASTGWLIRQFLKHRPLDLREATADLGDVAKDALKYQGLPTGAVEVTGPRLLREPAAHFYRTRVSAHLPDSMRPDDVVRAVERALWPRRVIISAEDASDTERSETLSLDGHTVGELIVYHSPPRRAAALSIEAPIEKPPLPLAPGPVSAPEPHSTPLSVPAKAKVPAPSDAPPLVLKPPAQATSPLSLIERNESPGPSLFGVPPGLWAPSLGPIVAGSRQKLAAAPARLAIIVDDGGYGGEPAEIILGLDNGLTFSILPNTPHCTSFAKEAGRRGFEVMLHMPMENTSPTLVHPGQLDARMDAAQMRRLTRAALAQVPGAVGINNHTGSKFTADSHALARFMEGLRDSGLFFVDSRTAQDSVAYEVARQFRVPAAARTLFLDDDHDTETIRARFRELVADAKRQGSAIGICHFRVPTAHLLRELLPTLAGEGVALVHASELVR